MIGELVMEALKGLDPVAYVRFASVYRDFARPPTSRRCWAKSPAHRRPNPRHPQSQRRPRRWNESIECWLTLGRGRSRHGAGSSLHGRGARPRQACARNDRANPAVGAVIVDDASGEMIARGWTQPGGRPHAEAHVLQRAGAQAHGKTMYVTLEPCSHHGRTPPCADAIRAAGVRRVVCAIEDPNPEISGKGFASLKQAGIAVETGVCAEAARWMAAGHILRMTRARPFVQLKLAVSADGLIAPGDGAPRWVTSEAARAYAHLLRARADAILIGRQTVADDDPQLTCRLPGLANRSPRRYVLDTGLRMAATKQARDQCRDGAIDIVRRAGRALARAASQRRHPPRCH